MSLTSLSIEYFSMLLSLQCVKAFSKLYSSKGLPSVEIVIKSSTLSGTGPRSAVGNVSGYRCVSDCRSRGREFDPGPVP